MQRIALETNGQYFYLTLAEITALGASVWDLFERPAYADIGTSFPLSNRLDEIYKTIQEGSGGEQRLVTRVVHAGGRLPGGDIERVAFNPEATRKTTGVRLDSFLVPPSTGGLT